MRIIVIGATGTIGQAVAKALSERHEIISVAYKRGDFQVNIASRDSIDRLYQTIGSFDAVICAAGMAKFGRLDELNDDDYLLGLNHKLMGQVNLVHIGRFYISDNGSFTLTSGVLAGEPIEGSSAISMANAGLNAFVRAAALEMQRGMRLNAVSPIWVKETLEAMGKDGSDGMPADQVARAYVESIESNRNGKILDVRNFI